MWARTIARAAALATLAAAAGGCTHTYLLPPSDLTKIRPGPVLIFYNDKVRDVDPKGYALTRGGEPAIEGGYDLIAAKKKQGTLAPYDGIAVKEQAFLPFVTTYLGLVAGELVGLGMAYAQGKDFFERHAGFTVGTVAGCMTIGAVAGYRAGVRDGPAHVVEIK